MIELVLAAATFAAPAELATRVIDGTLEVRGPRSVWKTREVHRTAVRNVIFVPGARVTPIERTEAGVTLQSYDAKRGAVIVVKPGTVALNQRVRFVAAAASSADVSSEEGASRPTGAKSKVRRAKPVSAEEARGSEGALPEPVLRDLAERRATQRDAPRDVQAKVPTVDAARAPEEATEAKTGLARIKGQESSGVARTLGVIALLALLGGVAWWLNRKRGIPDLESSSIEIISVKPLGNKHRLAIVEAAGERLLIAASDSEVRLLSTLSYAPTLESPEGAPLHHEDDERSEDVAGLLRLREESSAARDFDAVLQSVNPTQYVA